MAAIPKRASRPERPRGAIRNRSGRLAVENPLLPQSAASDNWRMEPATHEQKDEFELRHHPIHVKTFQVLCGVGVLLCIIEMFVGSVVLGNATVLAVAFTIFLGVILVSFITRKCRCPKCDALIKADKKLSSQGYIRYSCPSCRIKWQTSIRVGLPDGA